jgi:murein L,D-transpeptidase YafK
MKKKLLAFFVAVFSGLVFFIFTQTSLGDPPAKNSFRIEQKTHEKVKVAYNLKFNGIKKRLTEMGVDTSSLQIFIRGFKQEAEVEVWVKSNKNSAFQLYQTYPICASSGTLGPKRCQGDGQVPEGFYRVNVFNPYSNYLLSLGVSYPNASDNYFGCKRDRGGAIMIHGNCVTIGCIPLTDDKIREVYVLAVEARNAGQQNIPIHLFPARLSANKLAELKKEYTDKATQALWDNLKEGYDKFETTKLVPEVSINTVGKYLFK